VTQMTATRCRERRVMIVRSSDQTLMDLECGGLTPLFERKHRVGMFNFTDSIVINASAP
jgi:hypothetical protein